MEEELQNLVKKINNLKNGIDNDNTDEFEKYMKQFMDNEEIRKMKEGRIKDFLFNLNKYRENSKNCRKKKDTYLYKSQFMTSIYKE